MYLFVPTPAAAVTAPSPRAAQTGTPSAQAQTPPPALPSPADGGGAGQQPSPGTTPPPAHRIRRIPLAIRPPFRFRVKIGVFYPEDDSDTRRDTGDVYLRVEADGPPITAQQGSLRGRAVTFLTLGYAENTQNRGYRVLRVGSLGIAQRTTLPARWPKPGDTAPPEPGRLSVGGGLGLYLLSVSGTGLPGATGLHFGIDTAAEYALSQSVFVQAKYDFVFGGEQGYHAGGTSLLLGRRF